MRPKKQLALESAGFRIGDAEDFLELDKEERKLVELRVALSKTVRRLRERSGLTQQQLATKLRSSQSRIAKLEAASSDVSLDMLFRGLFTMGGEIDDIGLKSKRGAAKEARASKTRSR